MPFCFISSEIIFAIKKPLIARKISTPKNPYSKYLGKEDVFQNRIMRYLEDKYPNALFTHVANEGKRTPFEQYKMKYLGLMKCESEKQFNNLLKKIGI